MNIKQVVVIRKDLKMRRGKEIAQGAHAAMAFLLHELNIHEEEDDNAYLIGRFKTDVVREWMYKMQTKVTLQVNSEDELLAVYERAKLAGLTVHLITDAGATEFHGVPTKTCLAIGPDEAERIDAITRNLRLY